MTRKDVQETLIRARVASNYENRQTILLSGIHHLLYAIAEQLGVFDEENDENDENNE